ncbi:MAG: 50S ribosomal protein L11 methyltransferase [Actinomycetota bacterium]
MGWLLRILPRDRSPDDTEGELLAAALWDLGTTGLFQDGDGSIVAGFEVRETAVAAAAALVDDRRLQVTVTEPERAKTAAELAPETEPQSVTIQIDGRPVDLMIQVAGVFGHGHHPTTRLALDLLLTHLRPGERVLDVGTGTGILTVAAAAAGAGAAIGLDNDPEAVSVATGNLARNGDLFAGPASVGLWSVPEAVTVLGGPADLVVVNVLLPVHRLVAPSVLEATAAGGGIITTGYLVDQALEVAALYGAPAEADPAAAADGWVGHVFRP